MCRCTAVGAGIQRIFAAALLASAIALHICIRSSAGFSPPARHRQHPTPPLPPRPNARPLAQARRRGDLHPTVHNLHPTSPSPNPTPPHRATSATPTSGPGAGISTAASSVLLGEA